MTTIEVNGETYLIDDEKARHEQQWYEEKDREVARKLLGFDGFW